MGNATTPASPAGDDTNAASRHRDQRALVIYLAVSAGASVLISLVAALVGASGLLALAMGAGIMLTPALATLIATRITRTKLGDVGWKRFPIRYLIPALLTLALFVHGNFFAGYWLFGDGPNWASWLTPAADGLIHPPDEAHLGTDPLTQGELVWAIVQNAMIGLVLVSVLAFFEEIGWRGFMQPRLTARYGVVSGVVLSAVIWAGWHSPFAMSGLHQIEGIETWQLVLLGPIYHLGYGLFMGWLWERTQSIWLAMLAHGAGNNWSQMAFRYMEGETTVWELLQLNLSYLAAGLVCLALLWWTQHQARKGATESRRQPS